MKRARTIFTALAIVLAVATTTLVAHMKADKSEPAADSTVSASPAKVQVWFSQAPDAKLSKLEVAGPAGPVKLGAIEIAKDKSITAKVTGSLANGKYSVKWQAAGDDGHVQKGGFAFTVQTTR
jgi:copper resistance protein C